MTISALTKILHPTTHGRSTEWSKIEDKLRTLLPTDYKAFVEIYGSGAVDSFLWVLNPATDNPNLNLLDQTEIRLRALRELREAIGKQLPPAFPEPGGLVPWGVTDNGDVCYWRTGDPNPDRWPIVVADGRHSTWQQFDGTMTEFLAAVLDGRFHCSIFPPDFPSERPSFVPG